MRNFRFRDHVVLCLLTDEGSALTGLVNFVMPLRTSNVRFRDLPDIVVLCDTTYLRREWTSICNFPKIYVYHVSFGSPPRNPSKPLICLFYVVVLFSCRVTKSSCF